MKEQSETNLPPHLQALANKINEKKVKFKYTIEEIDCDEIFNNNQRGKTK